MAKTEVSCTVCGILFLKENKEINRHPVHCCSRSCVAKYKAKDNSRFNYYITTTKKNAKAKGLEYNLSTEYLTTLLDSQKGLCAISQLPLVMKKWNSPKSLYQASLDRIDNSKGYIKGNVHFVALGINYMRNTASLTETKEFLSSLIKTMNLL